MSLDGFITGPDDSMEWAFEYPGPNRIADEVMESTGAILAGRRWYDVATARYRGRGGIYGGAWDGPVFVLTHQPPDAPADEGITFLTDGVEDAVATARRAADDGNLEISAPTSPPSASTPACSTSSLSTSRPCCSVTASASMATPSRDGRRSRSSERTWPTRARSPAFAFA